MINWLILPMCFCVLFSTASGNATMRADRVYSCPGNEVVFTCVVNRTDLIWDIDFLTGRDIERVALVSSDPSGLQLHATSQGTVYHFNLTSKSPLTSTMTTIATIALSGATVSCRDGFTTSAHRDALVVQIVPEPQRPRNVNIEMPYIHPGFDVSSILNITLQLDDDDSVHLGCSDQSYMITVLSKDAKSGTVVHTPNMSVPLALHYDLDYNISVVASNCAGNSTPAEIRVRLAYCGPSTGIHESSVKGNQAERLTTYCLHSEGLQVLAVDTETNLKPDKSTSISECGKNGSTQHFGIKPVILVPVLTASHLCLSFCTLIIGLLLGLLLHRCCRSKKSSTDKNVSSSVEEPVYSESEIPPKTVPSVYRSSVKSVDNVAYGYISP